MLSFYCCALLCCIAHHTEASFPVCLAPARVSFPWLAEASICISHRRYTPLKSIGMPQHPSGPSSLPPPAQPQPQKGKLHVWGKAALGIAVFRRGTGRWDALLSQAVPLSFSLTFTHSSLVISLQLSNFLSGGCKGGGKSEGGGRPECFTESSWSPAWKKHILVV